ncbi:MAG: transcriptional repressor [bacterium]
MPGPPWWHGKFRDCGCRMTIPRQAVIDVLTNTSEHLSAEDIYIEIHKVYPAVGLTTVYRTLDLLAQMGMVFKFDFGDGRSRYELTESTKKHHHHLVCTNCGRIIDYSDFIEEEVRLFNQVEEALSQKHNFEIIAHQVQFLGRCNNCKSGK